MATGKIEAVKSMDVENYTVTFTNIGDITAYKYGRIASFEFEKTVLYNLTSGTKVMTLPTELYPLGGFRLLAVDSAGANYPLQFTSAGNVYVAKAVTANTILAFIATYITAS